MSIYYLTNTYYSLFNSLSRYFKFNLKRELLPLYIDQVSTDKIHTLIIYEEEKDDPELLNNIILNGNYKICILGHEAGVDINILNLKTLKSDLLKYIDNVSKTESKLFTEEELKDKVRNFFKGHGTESIYQVLSIVRFPLMNYELFFTKGLTENEYLNFYVIPAKEAWFSFIRRFEKYEPYLRLLKYQESVDLIKENIQSAHPFLEKYASYIQFGLYQSNDSLEKIKKNLDYLIQIDDILTSISRNLGLGDGQVQNSGS